MKKSSIAIALAMASVKSWSAASIAPSLYETNNFPINSGKTGVAAARRAAKKRRRARNGRHH